MKLFQTRYGQQLMYSEMDACELGVRDEKSRLLVRKEWTFMTNSENLHNILNMSCSHHTEHSWSQGLHTDIYPVQWCRRVVQNILKMERWNLIQDVLQQASMTQALTAETENSSERDEAILSALPISERRKLEL